MEYVLELEGLSKAFGRKRAVDNFSLKLERGHICGLIGQNGAGKTTIMRMMAGLTQPVKICSICGMSAVLRMRRGLICFLSLWDLQRREERRSAAFRSA